MQRARSKSGSITETALAISVLTVFCVFPLINLLGLATGASVLCLLAHETATSAAGQLSYADALASVQEEALTLNSTGMAKFAHLAPRGGYQNCGVDLYVVSTDYKTGGIKTYGPNSNINLPIDGLTYVYEYKTVVSCSVGPLLSMSRVPGLNQVPGLGKPALLSFSACRYIEHPDGLEKSQSLDSKTVTDMPSFGDPLQPMNTNAGLVAVNPTNGVGGWNYPGIYQAIQDSGQTIVASQVLSVNANADGWTDSGLEIGPGNKVWIDSWATGVWSTPGGILLNANGQVDPSLVGMSGNTPKTGLVDYNGTPIPYEALIGMIGKYTNNEIAIGVSNIGMGPLLTVGEDMINFVPPNFAAGEFYLGAATGTAPNIFWLPVPQGPTGIQSVRVIVTK